MKLPKKVYITAAVLLFLGGAGSAVALRPETRELKVAQTSSVSEPVQADTAAEKTPVVESVPLTEQTVTTQEAPPEDNPAPKTIDELKAFARQLVLDNNKCNNAPEISPACPAAQASCFEEGLGLVYGWGNLDEQFITNKKNALHQRYAEMCPALMQVKRRGLDPAFF